MSDEVLVLQCLKPLKMTKTIFGNGKVKEYGDAANFLHASASVSNIKDLSKLLSLLENEPEACIIRGSVKNDCRHRRTVNRRIHGLDACIEMSNTGHHWMMIDFDKLPSNIFTDTETLVLALPQEFHNASYHYQYSSSYRMNKETVSCHIFFWLEKPITDDKLRHWAKDFSEKRFNECGYEILDPSVYNTVQPNYTAKPIFIDIEDPAPNDRSGFIQKDNDTVHLVLPEPKPIPQRVYSPIPSTSSAKEVEILLRTIRKGGELCYEDWIAVSWATMNTIGVDVGVSMLKQIMPEQKEGEYDELRKSYNNQLSTTVGTLYYFAERVDAAIKIKLQRIKLWKKLSGQSANLSAYI